MKRVERQKKYSSSLKTGCARDKFLHHFSHLQSKPTTSQKIKSAIEANRRVRQYKQKIERILAGLFSGSALSHAQQIEELEERRAKKIGMMIASRVHFRSLLSFKIFLQKHEGLTAELFQKQLKSRHLTNQRRKREFEAIRKERQEKQEVARIRKNAEIQRRKNHRITSRQTLKKGIVSSSTEVSYYGLTHQEYLVATNHSSTRPAGSIAKSNGYGS